MILFSIETDGNLSKINYRFHSGKKSCDCCLKAEALRCFCWKLKVQGNNGSWFFNCYNVRYSSYTFHRLLLTS